MNFSSVPLLAFYCLSLLPQFFFSFVNDCFLFNFPNLPPFLYLGPFFYLTTETFSLADHTFYYFLSNERNYAAMVTNNMAHGFIVVCYAGYMF